MGVNIMIAAVGSLAVLGIALGFLLGLAARYLRVEGNPLAEEVESLLPAANCGQCGYPGCGPAAQAVANGAAPVTLCPPGGRALAQALAGKLGVSLDMSSVEDNEPLIAGIDETTCIGCAHCAKECPTDAIVGASKQIHTVIRDACMGCGKCLAVCPTECLQLHPAPVSLQTWRWPKPALTAASLGSS
jgi:electron transport complex protein RnfB